MKSLQIFQTRILGTGKMKTSRRPRIQAPAGFEACGPWEPLGTNNGAVTWGRRIRKDGKYRDTVVDQVKDLAAEYGPECVDAIGEAVAEHGEEVAVRIIERIKERLQGRQ